MSTEPNGEPCDKEAVKVADHNRLTLDLALANVVDLARRLNLTSVEGYECLEMEEPDGHKSGDDTERAPSVQTGCGRPSPKQKPGSVGQRATPKGSRFRKTEAHSRTPRGVQCLTAHLPVPPPPPPPSPRSPQARGLCLALERSEDILIQYGKTDELLEKLLYEAKAIDRQVILQNRLQRDVEMIRSLESEFSGRSMLYLTEAIRADCESLHVKELRQRCIGTLKRHEERLMELELDFEKAQDDGNGKGTQTDVYAYQDIIVPTLVEFDLLTDEQEPGLEACKGSKSGAGDGHHGQQKIQDENHCNKDS
ncbi:uncharacterized protein LOC108046093 [Drosophila rhopaloa]|uniref:Uncharacterized protein LOC108046093 n=1 Tax=Drosophila rhopaloa TaxID=1041015 RepID=A0A6P4ESK0_DRORH|nr:uncharacterized protein LOC108046093 [Drosophila rhopaloa]